MPKTWNQFVTEYAQQNQLSRKEAMNKARAAWVRYKKANPKGNDIPGFKKRDEVIDFPSVKPRKGAKGKGAKCQGAKGKSDGQKRKR